MSNIYNKFPDKERIRKIKKRNDRMFRIRLSAIALSAIMAVTPAMSCVAAYAEVEDAGVTTIETSVDTDTSTSVDTSVDADVGEGEQTVVVLGDDTESDLSVIADDNKEQTNFVFIHIDSSGGCVIINEGGDDEQYIRLVTREAAENDKEFADEDGNAEYIELYDNDGILISSTLAENSGNVYVYEIKTDSVVTLAAKADDGYKVTKYEVTCDEDVEFADDSKSDNISNPLFVDDDKTLTVRFEESDEDESSIDEDISVNDSKNDESSDDDSSVDDLSQDLTIDSETEDINDSDFDESSDTDVETDDDVDSEPEQEKITDTDDEDHNIDSDVEDNFEQEREETADIVNDTEPEGTDENVKLDTEDPKQNDEPGVADDVAAETEGVPDEADENVVEDVNVDTNVSIEQHETEMDSVDSLDKEIFSTARLVVMTDDSDVIIDAENVIANYDDIYLIQYETVEQSMEAYMYYIDLISNGTDLTVEPDCVLDTAENYTDGYDIVDFEITGETNPITTLFNKVGIAGISDIEVDNDSDSMIIALIDTGVSESDNVIDRVSLIDESLEGHGHGNDMLGYIVEQNADAQVLSIRTVGNDGRGTVSSVLAGIEYAVAQDADIINLSLYICGENPHACVWDESRFSFS